MFAINARGLAHAGVEVANGGTQVGEKQGGAVYGDKLAAEQ
jgi:hypothetical protein